MWGEIPHALGPTPPAVPGARWIPVVFGVAVYFYGSWVFIQGAWRELANRLPGMMTLISIAITVAFVFSLAVTFGFAGMTLWWELSSLITIMLFCHWMEMRSVTRAQGALAELAKLLPNRAIRLDGDRQIEAPLAEWREGDMVLVRPGEHRDDLSRRRSTRPRCIRRRRVVRPESSEAVRRLHDARIEVVMLTGNAKSVAEVVARELGIDEIFAEVLPDQKVSRVKELQARGRHVAMVGDGVNDAPALVSSDVGVAIGAGTDSSKQSGLGSLSAAGIVRRDRLVLFCAFPRVFAIS